MRFTIAASAALVAGASATYGYGSNATASVPDVYTTEVVTQLTTVCPTPTQVTYGGKTYTVTESTTLTITDCPCTISYPVAPTPPAQTPGVPAPPAPSAPAPVYPTGGNGTVPAPPAPVAPTGTKPPSSPSPAPPSFTGAASQFGVAGMAVVAAAAAFL